MARSRDEGENSGAFAPLREPVFRRLWSASLFSNFGQMFLSVGAAWEMTRLTDAPSMVALVQTALMVPLMFVTLPAGAIADMFDRRRIAMLGLGFAALAALALTLVSFADLITPIGLLAFCALVGSGVALFSPSWQASIPEQVSRAHLPAAVALGTISFNLARSFGPALGGVIVVVYGAKVVFGVTSLLYLPLLAAFFLWKRVQVPSRLPPERIDRAIVSGARYALHAPAIRKALVRVLIFGFATATATALAPLVAKDLLGGNAATFGILLGAQGLGAVAGALAVSRIRTRLSTEVAIRMLAAGSGIALAGVGLSGSLILTCLAYVAVGACNIVTIAMLNVTVQLSASRWVTARALSLFSSAITGGMGIGAWVWGELAGEVGIAATMIASGVAIALTVLVGLVYPLEAERDIDHSGLEFHQEPDIALPLTLRSGPVVIDVEFDVDPDNAREFYRAMMEMQALRKRIGAFQWSISRDIADPCLWIERFHCPTWGDYLRLRDRYSQADADLLERVARLCKVHGSQRVKRRLKRPLGSVRWQDATPDPHQEGTVGWMGPG